MFFTNITNFPFSYDLCCSFIKNFIFIFFNVACSLKYSQNFFIQTLHLYTLCLFSMLLNDDVVEIEKPDEISFLTFVVNEFSRLFLHQSIFSIKNSRSA